MMRWMALALVSVLLPSSAPPAPAEGGRSLCVVILYDTGEQRELRLEQGPLETARVRLSGPGELAILPHCPPSRPDPLP